MSGVGSFLIPFAVDYEHLIRYGDEFEYHKMLTQNWKRLVLGPPLFLPNPIDKLSIRALDIYNLYHGGPIPAFSPVRTAFVDVRDLAQLTFNVVEKSATSVKRNVRERYMVVGESGVSPQRMVDVLRTAFPERRDVIAKGNPGETYPEMTWRFDAGKVRALMPEPWVGFDRSVVETAEVFAGRV